jgi:hypothetical protein
MNDMKEIARVYDQAAIERLAYLYGRGVDARDAAGHDTYFDQCLLPDVEMVYEFGTWQGRDEHKRITAENMWKVFTFTHHLITNGIVDIDGDTATASYRCTAAHGMRTASGEKTVFGGSTYIQDCIRTPEGWRISRHVCEKSWIDDDGSLLAAMVGS